MATTTADRVWSVIAMVVAVGGAVLGFVPALMLAMASDSCSVGCTLWLLSTGWYIAVIAPPVIAVVGAIVTTVALIRNRRAARRAWLFVLVQAAAFALGVALVFAAAGWN